MVHLIYGGPNARDISITHVFEVNMLFFYYFEPAIAINEGKRNTSSGSCAAICSTTSTKSLNILEDSNFMKRKIKNLNHNGCVIFCSFGRQEPPSNISIGFETKKNCQLTINFDFFPE